MPSNDRSAETLRVRIKTSELQCLNQSDVETEWKLVYSNFIYRNEISISVWLNGLALPQSNYINERSQLTKRDEISSTLLSYSSAITLIVTLDQTSFNSAFLQLQILLICRFQMRSFDFIQTIVSLMKIYRRTAQTYWQLHNYLTFYKHGASSNQRLPRLKV